MMQVESGCTRGREEEEGGPVDRVAQPREDNQLIEVDREVCEV